MKLPHKRNLSMAGVHVPNNLKEKKMIGRIKR